ncbi:MAG: lysophospholipid acyltransferase family protein [Pseudomonadota bacterium]
MDSVTPPLSLSTTRAVLRAIGLLVLTLILFLPVLLLWALTLERLRAKLVRIYYNAARRISGVRVKVVGQVSPLRPLMLVANHSSYLDIFVLGSILPISFTPKLEIRSWPVIGFFCVLADCVFIERRPADMQRAQAEMSARLSNGKVLALFPEGTTGDGYHIMPFKSGFLNLVEAHDLPLQSVSIAYTHIGKVPLSPANREQVAWVGEASFVTHFARLLKFPYVEVIAEFYAVERISNHEDRKALAKTCEITITEGLHKTLEANGVVG